VPFPRPQVGATTATSARTDKCRAAKPESCSPFPMCAYYPATCTYKKTCDTPATKANKILDGKTKVRPTLTQRGSACLLFLHLGSLVNRSRAGMDAISCVPEAF